MTLRALRNVQFQHLLKRVQRPWSRLLERRTLERADALAGRLLADLQRSGQGEWAGGTPRVTTSLLTRSDVVVMLVSDGSDGTATRVLKLPLSPDAIRSTDRHRQVVGTLQSMPMLQNFVALVPRALAWGEFEGQSYYLETALAGTAASDLVRRKIEPASFKADAVRAIRRLHVGSSQRRVVGADAFARLAGDDLAALYQQSAGWPNAAALRDALQSVEAFLRRKLIGLDLPFAWTHGDYWPGNIMTHPGGGISGVLDWDRAVVNQLPLLDILHLFAYVRKMQQRTELGETLVDYVLPAAFDAQERALIDESLEQYGLPNDAEFWRAAVLLYWLRFAAANLTRYQRLQNDNFWLEKNIFTVLKRG